MDIFSIIFIGVASTMVVGIFGLLFGVPLYYKIQTIRYPLIGSELVEGREMDWSPRDYKPGQYYQSNLHRMWGSRHG